MLAVDTRQLWYGLCVSMGVVAALVIRRSENKRLGYDRHPRYALVGLGCLLGAVLGSKIGMLLTEAAHFSFAGKTILGALAGGYVLGELTKWLVGIRFSTGDALAVALPVGQAFGRLGCFLPR